VSLACEYLVSHGKSGAFGRFTAEKPALLQRGDRVVVRGAQGLELGTVLCVASERQQRVLGHTPPGQLVRRATPDDERQSRQRTEMARRLADTARDLALELALPMEILDADVLLDGGQALVQCLADQQLQADDFITALEDRCGLRIWLENLAVTPAAAEEEAGGCGKPGCGRASGGCSDCASGGCSSCGHGRLDLREYFAHLRARMEERQSRTSLL
jgi:cell fate regulator YaaT (PSP1 superfamily)